MSKGAHGDGVGSFMWSCSLSELMPESVNLVNMSDLKLHQSNQLPAFYLVIMDIL